MRYRLQAWTALPATTPHQNVLNGLTLEDDTFRHLSFTFAVIALSARVACIDGPVSKDKYVAFRESFPINGGICGKIRQLFTLACTNTTPIEHYTQQIRCLYPAKPELFTSVTERLFRIAAADGNISRKTECILADIARNLDLTPAAFATIREQYVQPIHAHTVLGVTAGTSSANIKKRYHELMRRYHPDRFASEELSDEIRLLLRAKTSEINAAYRILSKRAA